ncbi:MAG TPA: hypothetical protein VN039_10525 [Nitrospira sp.]|nr:hypothetical protein [Nitrospira sp.]
MPTHKSRAITIFLFVILVLLYVFLPEDKSVEQDARQYCQMVHDHSWPDFNRVYHAQCNADGTLNMDYINGR